MLCQMLERTSYLTVMINYVAQGETAGLEVRAGSKSEQTEVRVIENTMCYTTIHVSTHVMQLCHKASHS